MFLPVIIFSLGSNEVYAKTGLVTTLTLVISIMAAKIYGRVIDKKHGQAVIIFTSIVMAVVHFIIPFTRKAGHAIGLKFIGDIVTTGHDISVTRGQFDNSERSNNKLMYFGMSELILGLGMSFSALVLGIATTNFDIENSFKLFYIFAGLSVLLTCLVRFDVYRQK